MIDYLKIAQDAVRSLPPTDADEKVERATATLIAFAFVHTEAMRAAADMRRAGRLLRLDVDYTSDRLWLEHDGRHVSFKRTSQGTIEVGGSFGFAGTVVEPSREMDMPGVIAPVMTRAITFLVAGQM